jgi:hypothetical protein
MGAVNRCLYNLEKRRHSSSFTTPGFNKKESFAKRISLDGHCRPVEAVSPNPKPAYDPQILDQLELETDKMLSKINYIQEKTQ